MMTGCVDVPVDKDSSSRRDTIRVRDVRVATDTVATRDSIIVIDTVLLTLRSDGNVWDSTAVQRRSWPRRIGGVATLFARTEKGKTERKPMRLNADDWEFTLAGDDRPRGFRLGTVLPLAYRFPASEFGNHHLQLLQIQVPPHDLVLRKPIELKHDPSDGDYKPGALLQFDGRDFITGQGDVNRRNHGTFVIDSVNTRRRFALGSFRGTFFVSQSSANDIVVIEVLFRLDY